MTSQAGASDENAVHEEAQVQTPTRRTRIRKARKARTQTRWPTDTIIVGEVNDDALPLDTKTNRRLARVCGLAPRQRVPLSLDSFDSLTDDERKVIFKQCVLEYVVYPEHLHDKALKLSMKMIASLWRTYKSRLYSMIRNNQNPFEKYKHLKVADWEQFVAKCSTEEFQEESEYMSELRALNKLPHHLGPSGYLGKQEQWEQEDQRLSQEGRPNPWQQYPGPSQQFLRARGTVSKSGEVTFASSETQEVAKKVLAASTEGSVTGCREKDILSTALGNAEARGRVRAVSSYTTWKTGFPEDRYMYRKRKMNGGSVDVEQLRKTITRDIMVAIKPVFDSQGVPFPFMNLDSPILPTPEGNRSSFASAEVEQEDQASPMLEQPHDSIEPDTIDQLDQPTRCILLSKLGGYAMEVAKGLVYPRVKVLYDDVPVHDGFAVVKLDMVHANSMIVELEVPPDDTVRTLRDALYQMVQWRRTRIIIDSAIPVGAMSKTGQTASASPGQTASASRLPNMLSVNDLQLLKLPDLPHHPSISAPSGKKSPPKKNTQLEHNVLVPPLAKSATSDKNGQKKKKRLCRKNSEQQRNPHKSVNTEQIAQAWIKDNVKYMPGEPMLSANELISTGKQCVDLHNYYMRNYKSGQRSITLQYKQHHFLNGDGYFLVSFGDLYDLFNLDALDVSLLRCFTLAMIKEHGKECLGFGDPSIMTIDTIESERQLVVKYLVKVMQFYAHKEMVMCPHNTGGHWVLLVFSIKYDFVWYLDSLRPRLSNDELGVRNYSTVMSVLNEAFDTYLTRFVKDPAPNGKRRKLTHKTKFPCHQQPLGNTCGFYVAEHMLILGRSPSIEECEIPCHRLENSVLCYIRDKISTFLMNEAISPKGEFHCRGHD